MYYEIYSVVLYKTFIPIKFESTNSFKMNIELLLLRGYFFLLRMPKIMKFVVLVFLVFLDFAEPRKVVLVVMGKYQIYYQMKY